MSEDPNTPSTPIDASPDARLVIVWSRFNVAVVRKLVAGARQCLLDHAVSESAIDEYEVPGAWELSHAANQLARSGRYDAIVAVGAIIRGGTPHFDYVCDSATQGLLRVMLDTRVPIAFGVLTTDDEQQALERAGGAHGNKGRDAALTALEMIAFDRKLQNHGIPTQRP